MIRVLPAIKRSADGSLSISKSAVNTSTGNISSLSSAITSTVPATKTVMVVRASGGGATAIPNAVGTKGGEYLLSLIILIICSDYF